MPPRFSICIPNYNYSSYLDLTIQSLKMQIFESMEVLISDNCSTDDSVEIVKKHISEEFSIEYQVNPTNIGFAGNLDKVGSMAKGDWMIMFSSDDLVNVNALNIYDSFIRTLNDTQDFAFCSVFEKVDSQGNFIDYISPVLLAIL